MEASSTINTILSEARKLSKAEQLTLLQRLVLLLKKPEISQINNPRLSALTGLGSDLWRNTAAIDQYLDEERQW